LDECVNRFFVTAQVSGFRGSKFKVQGERKGLASEAEIRDEEPAASMDLSAD
jgi:hypothetical protein